MAPRPAATSTTHQPRPTGFLASKDRGPDVRSAPSQLEIETQLVVDRLLRECFTSKSPRDTGRIESPDDIQGEGKNFGLGPAI